MLAIRHVVGATPDPRRRYALMPSFTFAATAHAALWVGLRPLLSDIDPETWCPRLGLRRSCCANSQAKSPSWCPAPSSAPISILNTIVEFQESTASRSSLTPRHP